MKMVGAAGVLWLMTQKKTPSGLGLVTAATQNTALLVFTACAATTGSSHMTSRECLKASVGRLIDLIKSSIPHLPTPSIKAEQVRRSSKVASRQAKASSMSPKQFTGGNLRLG